jgi:CRP-like cAMP-binding protein
MLELRQSDRRPARSLPSAHLAGTRLASSFLTAEELQLLDAAASAPRAVDAHTDLVRESGTADQLFVMIHGWACRYKTTREGGRQIVGLLVPGDVANLDTLMSSRPGYGVRTLMSAQVAAIPRKRLTALATDNPGIAQALIQLSLTESAILAQWALCLGRQSAQQRLAHLLCELAVRAGDDEDNASRFELPLTQEQMADVLGLTAVHVNRTMQQLRNEGLIVSASRSITLPDLRRLRERANFDPDYLHVGIDEHCTWRRPLDGTSSGASPSSVTAGK